jgi:hypothetical protein
MRASFIWAAGVAALVWGSVARAQHIPGYNYDEAKVPAYTMLDPLRMEDGAAVTTAKAWWDERRPQILRLFEENIYGKTPSNAQVPLRAHVVEEDDHALGGTAIREQIDLYFTVAGSDGAKMRLLVYLPVHARRRVPVILGLNFDGNQAVMDDAGIEPSLVWVKSKETGRIERVAADAATRGSRVQQWQVQKILARGYGVATAYYGDLEPDFKGMSLDSVRALFGDVEAPAGDSWGAIGAWAWGLSRAVDYLETDRRVDGKRIAVTGHSRLGKAADWAAAQDVRIAALLSTESGKGGQSIQRRGLGESVYHLEHSFPYWFCPNYARWVGKDQAIPADGNLLLSLIAPRPLYVASAEGDEWSDPKGEFLSAVSASRVYALLRVRGLPSDTMPAVDAPLDEAGYQVAYHVRSGKHDVTAFDWDQYLNFLDLHFGRQVKR